MRTTRTLGTLAALALFGSLAPASAQVVIASGTVGRFASAQFDTEGQRMVITANALDSASTIVAPPTPPAPPGQTSSAVVCLWLYKGATLSLRHHACADGTIAIDPTLSGAAVAAQIPSGGTTFTIALSFAGSGQPVPADPIVVPPPYASATMSVQRTATAIGTATNENGNGIQGVPSSYALLALTANALTYAIV